MIERFIPGLSTRIPTLITTILTDSTTYTAMSTKLSTKRGCPNSMQHLPNVWNYPWNEYQGNTDHPYLETVMKMIAALHSQTWNQQWERIWQYVHTLYNHCDQRMYWFCTVLYVNKVTTFTHQWTYHALCFSKALPSFSKVCVRETKHTRLACYSDNYS